jgi:hypothetical protein
MRLAGRGAKLVLACLLCLLVVTGIALVIQRMIRR